MNPTTTPIFPARRHGTPSSEQELALLRPLARQYRNFDAALAEIARLSAELTLPKRTIHVISDIHGDDVKLRHVVNNASGSLRPMVERIFQGRLSPAELQRFLSLIFYPRETLELLEATLQDPAEWRVFCQQTLRNLLDVVRVLARNYGSQRASHLLPDNQRELLQDLLYEPTNYQSAEATDAIIESLVRYGRASQFIRLAVRVLRDMAIDELIIAGDFWDRGPRGDRVVDYLRRQPNVSITWGNHDAAWLGACLGQEALIAHVLRISTRYRRLSQLEEGYGIIMEPLEHLVREVYADDPASCFMPHGIGLRETTMIARMQKAAAIMQFKLEGQTIQRNPEWNLEHRRLLHHIDLPAGTIKIDGVTRPLRDTRFPTIDPARPYELSTEERICIDRIRQSFSSSQKLWEQMCWMVQRGSMYLKRDDHLIFHGCVPVDANGEFLELVVDGQPRRGRALFDAIEKVVARVLNRPTDKERDLLWYLWCGPLSPLFGKDRITTFENDLVADKATHVETKNPYFQLINETAFCDRVLSEFDIDLERGLIVNGHVPVKVEKGENPLKRSGKAITIDGAFSAAYGDHGYTLVLESDRTYLAEHHHFESVQQAVQAGVDIIPTIMPVRKWSTPRRIADTERGEQIRCEIDLLERLVEAYRNNQIRPK